jgi:ABC-type nitrate/sulfonate/bicarbonate transport system substrate-binding protein
VHRGPDAIVISSPRRSRMAVLALLSVIVAACGPAGSAPAPASTGSATPAPPTAPAPTPALASDAPATAPVTATPAATPAAAPTTVRLALDWTPNTNHLGFYVAQAKSWYDEAGIKLDVLPYGGTAPEAILAAHQAECGISFQDSLTFAAAAGAPIVSVMAILQHTAQEIAVLASSDITRPRQLDGKTYAGFGYPNEAPTLQSVIKADGGKGTFDTVTLDTAAYEALYAKRADFVITFSAWEGIEAGQRGIKLRTFKFTDYGFPDFYQVVLACDADWLAKNPAAAKAFVGATVRGFEYAAASPDDASAILVAQNPSVFDANPELPKASARYLAEHGLLTDAAGKVGTQTLGTWSGYSGFLYRQGLLVDGAGKPLTAAPDYASLFTNDYLP